MSLVIREGRGTSWRDPSQPGTRHYRSTSVSYRLGFGLLGYGAGSLLILPFLLMWWLLLAELWLTVEVYAVGISAIIVLASWWAQPASQYRARFARWGWIWYLTARP